MGSWGWSGLGDRALEFPENGEQVAVSPPDRARLRYNRVKNQLEQSLNGQPYAALGNSGGGAGSSIVTLSSTPYIVQPDDELVLVPGALLGASSVTIPLAATFPGRSITIKNLDAGGFLTSLALQGTDTIDTGAFVGVLAGDYTAITIKSDGGTGWYITSDI